MGDNLLSNDNAWYPRSVTQYHNKAFLKTLEQHNPEVYVGASLFFEYEKALLKGERLDANLSALWNLIQTEENKENNLMLDVFGKSGYDAMNTGERIRLINELYSVKGVFETNIKKIQAINEKGGGGRIDASTQFSNILRQEIDDFVNTTGLEYLTEDILRDCVERALLKLFEYRDRKTDNQPYIELADALNRLHANGQIDWALDELFALYFGVSFREVTETLAEAKLDVAPKMAVDKVKKKLWGDYLHGGKKGNVLEVVEALTQNILQESLGGNTYRTGATGMKADNIITYNISVDLTQVFSETETEKTRSVRARSIDLLDKMFKKVGAEGGYIVEISDKNYSLTSDKFAENKGFAAQTNFKLNNFEEVLKKMGVDQGVRSSLMFVLANTDSELIGGADANDVCRFVATYLGYFLFDDLQITNEIAGMKTQAVHLFNLDGIYIPLSVFLRAAHYAFTQLPTQVSDYVNVQFNSRFNYKKQIDGLQEEDWTRLYQQRLTESSLDIHFFGNFVQFIKDNIKL